MPSNTLLGLVLLLVASVIHAQSVQLFQGSGNVSLAYLQTPNGSSTDLRLRISGPASHGWIAVGLGSSMINALMFILYPNSDQSTAHVSVRSATAHVEPSVLSGVSYSVLSASLLNKTLSADIVCYGCSQWPTGSFNVNSLGAPCIYAVGPESPVASSADDASLQQHGDYGFFSLNTANAVFADKTPLDPFIPTGNNVTTTQPSNGPDATEGLVRLHAIIFCGVWLLVAPLAIFLLRFKSSVRLHWILQSVTLGGVVLGLVVALILSAKLGYVNKTHQILGIVVAVAALLQGALGFGHHVKYKAQQRRLSTSDISGPIPLDPTGSPVTRIKDSNAGFETARSATVTVRSFDDLHLPPRPPGQHRAGLLRVTGFVHAWFGRAVVLLGAVNALLGAILAGEAKLRIFFIFTTAAVAVGLVYTAVVARRR